MLIAVFGVVGFGSGIVRDSTIATSLLYAWAAPWTIVSSIASSLALVDSTRNFVRFRFRGYVRSRFWFEMARSSCILGVMVTLLTILIGVSGLPLGGLVGDVLFYFTIAMLGAFCITSSFGYAFRAVTSRHLLGRATQCVDFFYPPCVGGMVVAAFLMMMREQLYDPWAYGSALATLVVTCLSIALALILRDRWKGQRILKIKNSG